MNEATPRLTATDLALLAELDGSEPDGLGDELRRRPWRLGALLSEPATYEAVVEDPGPSGHLVSPFLVFAVFTHRAAAELREATWVNDWSGPRQRLPVFDVAPLQEFAEGGQRLLFLAGLLASFADPEPIPLPVPVAALDLHELARWLEVASVADRAVLLRRLGDLALFLAGVFPDRTGPDAPTPEEAERLGGSAGLAGSQILALVDPASPAPGIDALESLGPQWYGRAVEADRQLPPVVGDIASRFRAARRFLNHVTDRYLYRTETAPAWLAP